MTTKMRGETPSFSPQERQQIWKEFLEDVFNCYPDPDLDIDTRLCDLDPLACEKCKSLDTVALYEEYISKYKRCSVCHRPRITEKIDNMNLCYECFNNYLDKKEGE